MVSAPLKRIGAGAVPVVGLLILVLLSLHFMSTAVQNSEQLSRLFVPLLIASVVGLFALVIVVGVNIVQLTIRYRQQAAGSRLTLRMVIIFVTLSLAPVAVVYYYSQQFLLHGIDSWFDVQIDQAMDDALQLSKASLDLHKRERYKSTQRLLSEMSGFSLPGLSLSLEELREKFGAVELDLIDSSGKVLVSVNVDPTILVPSDPDSSILQQVQRGEDFVGLTLKEQGDLIEVRVVLNDRQRGLFLQAIYNTSANITQLAETVQNAYNRYKELTFLRKSLKNTFTLTLALVLLFGLLAAFWAAFFSARRMVAPLANIAEGTRAVAEGDYDKRLPLPRSADELSFLVSSFNSMTRSIAQARDQAARSQEQLETQHAYLEAVLARLSSGVIALDNAGFVGTANQAAHDILRLPPGALREMVLDEIGEASQAFKQFYEIISVQAESGEQDWREEVTLFGADGRQVLLCRGTPLNQPDGEHTGYVVVFDDITQLVRAQRDAAWGEVARRLAHEIKNPLTPIQLSAERLRRKYLNKMPTADAEVLDKATHTIVQQVEAMKSMVNDFSDYARPPKMSRQPLVLDELVEEVVNLYRSAGMKGQLKVDLAAEQAWVEADPVRLRQVMHNLIKNATEAAEVVTEPCIWIETIKRKEAECLFVEFRIMDNGPGFDSDTKTHLFEPYVTTKVKGTGLGLAIVKKIIEEHGGMVWADNRPEGGASVVFRLPMFNVKEGDGSQLCQTLPAPQCEGK
ncbi:MAG: ATP-binding protein [Chromatiales bacterium]|nr:ATP-binding protein [Chromatiales bacterium]